MQDTGKRSARRSLFALPGCLLALFVIAGCGGSGDGETDQGVPATFVEGPCEPGGNFVMGLEEEPATLLPASARLTAGTARIDHLVFSHLVELDQDGEPRPSLAEKWDVSEDASTYSFELKPNAKWHDGRPVTSKDVAATVDYLQNANPDTFVWEEIKSVKTPDTHRVIIELKDPFPGFLTALANVNDSSSILPAHYLLQGEDPEESDLATKPVGSGPFRFVQWKRGSQIELERNEDYFEEGRPCFDRVIARFMPDEASRKIAFESGEVDWLYSYMVPLEDLSRFASEDESQVLQGGLGTAVTDFLVVNTKNRYLGNQRVREAIAYAIDREQLNELGFYGFGEVAHSTMNSAVKDLYTDEYDVYETDLDKANSLLDEAGFPRGEGDERFTLNLRVRPDRAFESRIADGLRTQLAKVGINVVLRTGDAASVYDFVYSKFDFDMVVQLKTTGPDPATQMPPMFRKVGIGAPVGNAPRLVDPELEALFEEVRTEPSADRRRELWSQIQERTMRNLTWIPLVEYPNLQLISSEFENVIVGPLDYLGNLEFARQATE